MESPIVPRILSALQEPRPLIQVILGPRQVGKTTAAQIVQNQLDEPTQYISADDVIAAGREWLLEKWLEAQSKLNSGVLIIDEIQKVHNWSETIKKLWDEQARSKHRIKLLLLGSSSLQLHSGLSESLTGRFELHHIFQWSWPESNKLRKMTLDQYLQFGGYPGSYAFIAQPDRWRNFLKNSIIGSKSST